ncbi:hypothetical protein V6N12_033730 [Hibiscus sabdariffa]|uniref:MORF/ORRM1/DAG-like MORF domain-containing protein n=1 Tax=Hibiscus sabdariffa TaxID=183260 RepID=A0ABR1Z7G9_9ROSI
MVRTYENICAQGLGISVEEAKKRIYACSTSTYEGFQVLMSEEESEKFNDVPGVVFCVAGLLHRSGKQGVWRR